MKSLLVYWEALVSVEDLRLPISLKRFFQSACAKTRIQGVRKLPGQDLAVEPVHYDREIKEALAHAHIRDIRAPDLVGSCYVKPPQEVRVDPVFRVVPAESGLRVYGFKSHETEQSSNPFQVDPDPFSLKPELHALYSPAGVFRVLPVHKIHQIQVLTRFFAVSFLLYVDAGAVESQKLALPTHGEFYFSWFQSISKL